MPVDMSQEKSSKYRFSWWNHLLLFIVVQVIFILFDGSKIWMIFNLNKLGERFASNLDWVFGWFQFYKSEQLNFFTVTWIGILMIHGIMHPKKTNYRKKWAK